jgi:hypothetical protein
VLPVDFSYWSFAALTFVNGFGAGMFSAPNSSSLMSSVPPADRGVASGMRATFQNSGVAISIGAFFSVMIAGLAGTLPLSLKNGLIHQGVAPSIAAKIGHLPPVSSLFAATLGVNPLQHLLMLNHALSELSVSARRVVTDREFFPHLIAQPFHEGLVVVFSLATGLAAVAAIASLMRGPTVPSSSRKTTVVIPPVEPETTSDEPAPPLLVAARRGWHKTGAD